MISCNQPPSVKSPKILKTCFKAEPTTLDPRRNSEPIGSRLQLMLYEGLTRLLADGEIEWALAESVDIQDNGCTYIFYLKKALWSDGAPITAHDFEYSWKTALAPSFGAPNAALFSPILNAPEAMRGEISVAQIGVSAIDDYTLKVRLSQPTPYFLSLVSFCPFYPIPTHADLTDPLWSTKRNSELITSGPYQLIDWQRGSVLTCAKSLTYHDQEQVALDGIQAYIISDDLSAIRLFEDGQLDWMDSITAPIAIDEVEFLKNHFGLETRQIGGTYFCAFNLDSPIFANRNIRRALSGAIDRRRLVEHICVLNEEIAHRLIPPILCKGRNRDLVHDADWKESRDLFAKGLKELGLAKLQDHPDWKNVCFSYESGDQNRRIAQILQDNWMQALGIYIPLSEMDYKSQLASIENRQFTLTLDYWLAHINDPSNILERFKYRCSKKNYPGFENSAYIDLLTRASCSFDPDERMRLFEEAEELFIEEMPLTPIFHQSQAILKRNVISSIALNPIGNPNYKTILLTEAEDE